MSWTKREFVAQAFEELGYASYIYDLQPEQLQSALRRLDSMMASWNALGVRIGYPLPSSPSASNLEDATNVPDAANEAIYSNLAIRLASSIGKTASIELKKTAKAGYLALLSHAAKAYQMQYDGSLPTGAGNKRLDAPFVNPPSGSLDAGLDNEIEFE